MSFQQYEKQPNYYKYKGISVSKKTITLSKYIAELFSETDCIDLYFDSETKQIGITKNGGCRLSQNNTGNRILGAQGFVSHFKIPLGRYLHSGSQSEKGKGEMMVFQREGLVK